MLISAHVENSGQLLAADKPFSKQFTSDNHANWVFPNCLSKSVKSRRWRELMVIILFFFSPAANAVAKP